ncbi:papain like protease [Nonlabens dokdonensis]|uniref:Papain like protease n=2 Tax=Nonlabens dokdonensis TaxID=328515 RepID=A0ABX5Q057_9FLAO|nr:C1 family peptidase [Nonlabens dokdonensis]AGC75759.1 putative cysteine protease [Nonlabens dokdonensis DSW-6]PZX43443.1 papain like protease [Nonlabens dokdonensis]
MVTNSDYSITTILPTISVAINGERKRYIDIFETYEGDLTNDIFTGKLPYYLINAKTKLEDGTTINNYGAHAVNIVGYNDKGFIFKNSWGTDLGDNGYGYISFAAHKLMSREGLFFANIDVLYPEKISDLRENAIINLKTSLFFDENSKPNFYLTLEQPLESFAIKQAEFIIYNQQNKEISRKTITFKDDTEKLLGFAPFEKNLMPPDFLLHKDHLNINVNITGENGLLVKRYYRAIKTGAGIYNSRDIENPHTVNLPDGANTSFKELFVFEDGNMGFEVSATDFHRALQNSKVDFTADKKLVYHNVFYKGQPFNYAAYKFNYDQSPKLVEVELVFNSDNDAKTYFKQHYTPEKFKKFNAVLERPLQTTMYLNQEVYPKQAQVWYWKNKIFLIARLQNSKWSKS